MTLSSDEKLLMDYGLQDGAFDNNLGKLRSSKPLTPEILKSVRDLDDESVRVVLRTYQSWKVVQIDARIDKANAEVTAATSFSAKITAILIAPSP